MSETPEMTCVIRRAASPIPLDGDWDSDGWRQSETVAVDLFHPRSSDHHPKTFVRALYDDQALHVIFRVDDRYVRSVVTERNGPVCQDSCVEFFVQPVVGKGYLNFETNAGGVLHCSYIELDESCPGSRRVRFMNDDDADRVGIWHSMPSVVSPETSEEVGWINQLRIPFSLLARYTGALCPISAGAVWRGNFYKCADGSSHPHWGMWSPVDVLNFHQPKHFGRLLFA